MQENPPSWMAPSKLHAS